MDLLWADIGETLGMTVPEMRSLRNTFGDLLGLTGRSRVPEDLVPVIAFIHRLRQRGVADADIERELKESQVGGSWPEAVLARMQAAATVPAITKEAPIVAKEAPTVATEAPVYLEETSVPQSPPALYLVKPSYPETTEATARELVTDLRREICTHTVEERELLHRMNQLLQTLILEVRDLRYAFLLATSRKDRKRGIKSISRLLSG